MSCISIGADGISISDQGEVKRLTASASASQQAPKGFYVYGHFDRQGVPFYIGKGTGRRAWSVDRHLLWHRYVNKHLDDQYSVVILEDGLSADEAEELESGWIAQESETLVNWVNFGRKTNFKVLAEFHDLRDRNRELIAQARNLEATDLLGAIELYQKALVAVESYAKIQPEQGLVGRLIDEQLSEFGIHGDLSVLDRLTLCLCKVGKRSAALAVVDAYFSIYRADSVAKQADRIRKRVNKSQPTIG